MNLYELFDEVKRIYLKKKDMNHGHHVNLILQENGKLKVSFDYIDWLNTEFDQLRS
ncbi:immunity protein YezG family protein [Staphylococcus aureus]